MQIKDILVKLFINDPRSLLCRTVFVERRQMEQWFESAHFIGLDRYPAFSDFENAIRDELQKPEFKRLYGVWVYSPFDEKYDVFICIATANIHPDFSQDTVRFLCDRKHTHLYATELPAAKAKKEDAPEQPAQENAPNEIGAEIRKLRTDLKWSQNKLATELFVARNKPIIAVDISCIERGVACKRITPTEVLDFLREVSANNTVHGRTASLNGQLI